MSPDTTGLTTWTCAHCGMVYWSRSHFAEHVAGHAKPATISLATTGLAAPVNPEGDAAFWRARAEKAEAAALDAGRQSDRNAIECARLLNALNSAQRDFAAVSRELATVREQLAIANQRAIVAHKERHETVQAPDYATSRKGQHRPDCTSADVDCWGCLCACGNSQCPGLHDDKLTTRVKADNAGRIPTATASMRKTMLGTESGRGIATLPARDDSHYFLDVELLADDA